MHVRKETVYSGALGREMDVLAFGHFGTPIIAFPSGGGAYHDFDDNGMVDALGWLIDAGQLKVYCPGSVDRESWLAKGKDPHHKALCHRAYEAFIVEELVPAICHDCQTDDIDIGLVGCSLGAYHAVNFGLKFPHIFPYALGMSGRYDAEAFGGASGSQEVYFNNPMAYVANLQGDALAFVRARAHIVLVCGQGAWEEQCLDETVRLAGLLDNKGISHECDVWGYDVEHHWYWWRKQVAYHFGQLLG